MKKLFWLILIVAFLSSCSNNDSENDVREFVPGDVIVGIKSGTDINDVFNFINTFDLEVESITSLSFTSDLPSDSLQAVLDNLNQKVYTNDGVTWFVTGYLHFQTNQIWVFPRLFDMNIIDFQQDWLLAMTELELKDKHVDNLSSGVIMFKVTEGQESKWEKQFETYDIVGWAELNYIAEIELFKD